MYLLNDMVLLARSSNTGPDSLNTGKLKLIAMISTKEILVKDLEDTPSNYWIYIFKSILYTII